MRKQYIKGNQGFATTDVLIAIAILAAFSTLVVMLSYNIYLQSAFTNRTSKATEYAIKIFEHVDEMQYSSLNTANLVSFISNLDEDKVEATTGDSTQGLTSPYKVLVNITNSDVAKKVNIEIQYAVGKKTKSIQMQRLKPISNS